MPAATAAGLPDPIDAFAKLFERARASEPLEGTASALATADPDGRPSVRMVLLKGADAAGFVFFTNYESRKARELDANPFAALCFHWPTLDTQVRVEGGVTRLPPDESDAYFGTRLRESQIGAWASPQSRPIGSREELVARFEDRVAFFGEGAVTRPPHWGGYRILPDRIEFWTAREYRLHDRLLYVKDGEGWRRERLAP